MIADGPMTSQTTRILVGTCVAYLTTALAGAWICLRDGLVGEPFGVGTGRDVRNDLARGFGAALCAPAPLLLGLGWLTGRMLRVGDSDRATVGVVTGLGAAFLGGMAAEPVTHQVIAAPGAHPDRTAVVAANLVLPAVMVVTGLYRLAGRLGPVRAP
jgi:hypothetical protein